MDTKRQIIATSFNINRNLHHDIKQILRYISENLNKEKVNICFLSTASNDSSLQKFIFWSYVKIYYNTWNIWCPDTDEASSDKDRIVIQDVIFIGGGNTFDMINKFKETSFDIVLRQAYENGVIMSGVSAGLICWFEKGITDSH